MPTHFLCGLHTKTTSHKKGMMRAVTLLILHFHCTLIPFHYRMVRTTLAVQHVVLITYYLRKEGLSNYQVTSRQTACLS